MTAAEMHAQQLAILTDLCVRPEAAGALAAARQKGMSPRDFALIVARSMRIVVARAGFEPAGVRLLTEAVERGDFDRELAALLGYM